MMRLRRIVQCGLAIGTCASALALTPTGAAAQQPAPVVVDRSNTGPLAPTPIPTTIVFSPDAKVTMVNHAAATLEGMDVGRLYDDRLFLGGGGYWLASPDDGQRLFYGGVIAGWRFLGGRRLSLGMRALAGVGAGTVFATFPADGFSGGHVAPTMPGERRVEVSDGFLVFEPEIDAAIGVTDGIHVTFGAGYRATTADTGTNDPFRGATGTIGVQFDVGR